MTTLTPSQEEVLARVAFAQGMLLPVFHNHLDPHFKPESEEDSAAYDTELADKVESIAKVFIAKVDVYEKGQSLFKAPKVGVCEKLMSRLELNDFKVDVKAAGTEIIRKNYSRRNGLKDTDLCALAAIIGKVETVAKDYILAEYEGQVLAKCKEMATEQVTTTDAKQREADVATVTQLLAKPILDKGRSNEIVDARYEAKFPSRLSRLPEILDNAYQTAISAVKYTVFATAYTACAVGIGVAAYYAYYNPEVLTAPFSPANHTEAPHVAPEVLELMRNFKRDVIDREETICPVVIERPGLWTLLSQAVEQGMNQVKPT